MALPEVKVNKTRSHAGNIFNIVWFDLQWFKRLGVSISPQFLEICLPFRCVQKKYFKKGQAKWQDPTKIGYSLSCPWAWKFQTLVRKLGWKYYRFEKMINHNFMCLQLLLNQCSLNKENFLSPCANLYFYFTSQRSPGFIWDGLAYQIRGYKDHAPPQLMDDILVPVTPSIVPVDLHSHRRADYWSAKWKPGHPATAHNLANGM